MSDATEPEAASRVRFVVLRHTDRCGVHFDLMIESGDHLAAWRCLESPESSGGQGQPCDQLGDHRRLYLDYEGPISGDRGEVTRHDEGSCEVRRSGEEGWEVVFYGRYLKGPHSLRRLERRRFPSSYGSEWSLRAQ